jgi:hypothetical protein
MARAQVGPTQKPCTKGLWLWSEPVPMVARDGTHFHMCLLDCEGIDAYDQTGSYSVQLFSLAVLLSSLFVYNQMGGIDEAALERLQLIVEMTKVIKVRPGGSKTARLHPAQTAGRAPWVELLGSVGGCYAAALGPNLGQTPQHPGSGGISHPSCSCTI